MVGPRGRRRRPRPADGRRIVAPALEIVVDGLFDTAAKYDGSADFRIPALLADIERKALEDAALRVYDALGCAGWRGSTSS